jgi:hypothetical protein
VRLSRTLLVTCGALCACACSSAGHGDAPSDDTAATDAGLVDLGAMYVTKRGCKDCHDPTDGSQGLLSGNTEPVIAGTQVYAANITPDPTTSIGLWTDDAIARAVREGYSPGVVTLCPEMTRFDHMGDDEARAIIAYLRQIPAILHTIPASICPPIKPNLQQ